MTGRISSSMRAVAVALLAGLAGVAHAGPGNGIRLGGSEGRLHPFLDVETRYDSNVEFSDAPIGDLILHFRPGLELRVPSDLALVEFSGALDWAQYLGLEESDTSDLSKLYANAGLAVLFNRRGAVSVRLDDDYRRQPSATSLAAAANAVVSDSNVLTVAVPVRPGGGALVVTGGARWLIETFSSYLSDDQTDYGDLGYGEVRGDVEAQWRFLPRTSTLFQAGYFQRMPNAATADDIPGFDVLAGVTGLLTPHVGATAKIGYASSSYTNTSTSASDSLSSAVADLGVEWLPIENLSVRAGYARSLGVDPDPDVAVYVSDAVSGGLRVRLAQRIAFNATARWDRLSFDAIPDGQTTYLRIDPSIEGVFGRWLTVSGGYVYSSRDTSWPVAISGATAPLDYSKNEIYLKAGVTY